MRPSRPISLSHIAFGDANFDLHVSAVRNFRHLDRFGVIDQALTIFSTASFIIFGEREEINFSPSSEFSNNYSLASVFTSSVSAVFASSVGASSVAVSSVAASASTAVSSVALSASATGSSVAVSSATASSVSASSVALSASAAAAASASAFSASAFSASAFSAAIFSASALSASNFSASKRLASRRLVSQLQLFQLWLVATLLFLPPTCSGLFLIKLATVSVGCAPTEIQYCTRSCFKLTSAGSVIGLYVPTFSRYFPSRLSVFPLLLLGKKVFSSHPFSLN